jgi:outer membrane protein TolC
MRLRAWVVLLVCMFMPTEAVAQSGASPLTLRQLLESVQGSHQGMDIARARVRAAEGAEMAARGAFDLSVEGSARTAPVGTYSSTLGRVGLRQPTTLHGLNLGLWYENGADFPSYYEESITSAAGKVTFQALLPLLRNGSIDGERYRKFQARLQRQIAEREAEQIRADLFAAASRMYFSWVIAGQVMGVYASQLQLAEDRAQMLEQEVRAGSLPEIDLIDNQRLVLSRRADLALGELELERRALALSNFYRDEQGGPMRVPRERLPKDLPSELNWREIPSESLEELLRSPALSIRKVSLEILDEEMQLAKNSLLPRLDFGIEASHARGQERPFPYIGNSLSESVVAGSLTFQSSVQLRQARGRLAELRAKKREVELELRLLQDQLQLQVAASYEALRRHREAYALSRESRLKTEEMARAESEKFALGESSILAVNLREDAVLRARQDELKAIENFYSTWIELARTLGRNNLEDYVIDMRERENGP